MRPMSERAWNVVAASGMLIYGLSGIDDLLRAEAMGWFKLFFLVLGGIGAARLVVEAVTRKNGRDGR